MMKNNVVKAEGIVRLGVIPRFLNETTKIKIENLKSALIEAGVEIDNDKTLNIITDAYPIEKRYQEDCMKKIAYETYDVSRKGMSQYVDTNLTTTPLYIRWNGDKPFNEVLEDELYESLTDHMHETTPVVIYAKYTENNEEKEYILIIFNKASTSQYLKVVDLNDESDVEEDDDEKEADKFYNFVSGLINDISEMVYLNDDREPSGDRLASINKLDGTGTDDIPEVFVVTVHNSYDDTYDHTVKVGSMGEFYLSKKSFDREELFKFLYNKFLEYRLRDYNPGEEESPEESITSREGVATPTPVDRGERRYRKQFLVNTVEANVEFLQDSLAELLAEYKIGKNPSKLNYMKNLIDWALTRHNDAESE